MKNYLLIFFLCAIFNKAQSTETKIVHIIQNEIITNVDIKNEFKYLAALNNSLKELDKEQIISISNQSVIREKIKKIEISKNFKEIKINEEYENLLLKNIYSSLSLKSLREFEIYIKDYTSMSPYLFLWNFVKFFLWASLCLISAYAISFFDKKFYQNEILKERWFNLSKNNFLNQLSSIIIYSSGFSGFWYLMRLLTIFLDSI